MKFSRRMIKTNKYINSTKNNFQHKTNTCLKTATTIQTAYYKISDRPDKYFPDWQT